MPTITAPHKLPVVAVIDKRGLTDMSDNLRGQRFLAFLDDQMEQIRQIAGFRDADLMCQNLCRRGF